MLSRMGRPDPINHPVRELLDVAAEVKAWKELLLEKVDDLEDLTTTDQFGAEQARALVTLYTASVDQFQRILVSLAKLDLEAKMLRVDQAMVALLGGVVRKAMADVLPPDLVAVLSERIGRGFDQLLEGQTA